MKKNYVIPLDIEMPNERYQLSSNSVWFAGVCPICGAKITSEENYCHQCGSKLNWSSTINTNIKPSKVKSLYEIMITSIRFYDCKKCGQNCYFVYEDYDGYEEDRYCRRCGREMKKEKIND